MLGESWRMVLRYLDYFFLIKKNKMQKGITVWGHCNMVPLLCYKVTECGKANVVTLALILRQSLLTAFSIDLKRFHQLSAVSYRQNAGKVLSMFLVKNQQWQSFPSLSCAHYPCLHSKKYLLQTKHPPMLRLLDSVPYL